MSFCLSAVTNIPFMPVGSASQPVEKVILATSGPDSPVLRRENSTYSANMPAFPLLDLTYLVALSPEKHFPGRLLTSWEWREPATIIHGTTTTLHPDVSEGQRCGQPMLYLLLPFTTTA